MVQQTKRWMLCLTTGVVLFVNAYCFGQTFRSLKQIKAPAHFENVHAMKIAEDSLQSSFLIWVKSNVKGHFHQAHTENIVVIEGTALMQVGTDTLRIQAGDYLNIPKTTPHAVLKVLSKKPLKVLSIQSPAFYGNDRIFIEETH
jgi:mannose-6-phosphate isomerase-like protein (cupin superfamily)